jgi:hypothetical protein
MLDRMFMDDAADFDGMVVDYLCRRLRPAHHGAGLAGQAAGVLRLGDPTYRAALRPHKPRRFAAVSRSRGFGTRGPHCVPASR